MLCAATNSMFGPGIAISAIAASANRASVDGAGIAAAYRPHQSNSAIAAAARRAPSVSTSR